MKLRKRRLIARVATYQERLTADAAFVEPIGRLVNRRLHRPDLFGPYEQGQLDGLVAARQAYRSAARRQTEAMHRGSM